MKVPHWRFESCAIQQRFKKSDLRKDRGQINIKKPRNMAPPVRILVAAIDFGTTYSGYAFSFRQQFDRDPTETSGRSWNQSIASLKTPTCILLDSEQQFSAFGSDAEDKYAELASDDKHKDWYYFKHFKMKLHNEMGLRNMDLEDATGKTMSASKVFALSIGYLKDDMLKMSMKQMANLKESDIYWVLTTPAIWSDSAKQFMREAAIEAGINKDSLTIALEPEAASIYCRYAKLQLKQSEKKQSVGCFAPGTRYAVLDAGGGTVDITIHEVNKDGTLKEIHRANGGPWGGTMVDEEFFKFLTKTVGAKIMHRFRNEYMEDYLSLVRSFELKKGTIGPESTNQVTLRVPYALRELFEKQNGESVENVFEHMNIDKNITWKDDKLKFTADAMKQFFEEPLLKTVKQMRAMLNKRNMSVSHVLMVGGFSESPMLQHSIISELGSCTVLVPPQASLAVLRGAVIFGHDPSCITHRVCRYTYGVDTNPLFIAGKHDEKRKCLDANNKYRCIDCFSKHVEIDQRVRCGQWQKEQEYLPNTPSQKSIDFEIFASENKNPQYVDEPGCIKLGRIEIPLPDTTGGRDRRVGFQMCYSGTSLSVKARNKKTHETIECSVALPVRILVAAIDFGTTYSGYAFSFRQQFDRDPTETSGRSWNQSIASLKTPTCILLDSEQQFSAFGSDAEDKYAELASDDKHKDWYYFKHFKMKLHDEMGLRNMDLEDATGKTMSASKVFALSIEYLKDDMLKMSMKQMANLKESDIYWVLTTPAIWSDSAKQFIFEYFFVKLLSLQAGINKDSLTIALEPEAASIYCRYAKLQLKQSEKKQSVGCFAPGTRYAVLDAGGGTVDITIHEVNKDGTLKEIHRANGGPWGGTMVDEEFFKFLTKTVGAKIMHRFRNEYMEDYLSLMRSFELKKRTIGPESTNQVTLRVPYALRELFEKQNGKSVENVFEHMNIDKNITWKDDKLKFTADAMKQFFEEPLLETVKHLRALLNQRNMSVSHVLMVGGFSESPMLQHSVMSGLGSCTVLVPPQASLAVLRGAVIFGHDPSCITHRVCRYTYGVDTNPLFIAGEHDEKRKCLDANNKYRCIDCFSKHVEIGQLVRCGQWQKEQTYIPNTPSQKSIDFEIFASVNKNPKYVDEPCCIKLGSISIPLADTKDGLNRPVGVKMCYSGTSLSVKARNKKTDKTIECSVNFQG
ncbi:hypothetical protein ScPMuIL_004921 [Solemya velum]